MDIAEQIGVYVFATVVQLPFHLVIALPWLLLAWAVAAFTQQRVRAHTRLVLVSGIAAVGLAPAYGTHLSLLPIYTLVIGGEAQPVRVAVSFLTTWVLILLVGLAITWLRGRRQPPGSNPLLQRDAPTSGAPLS